MLIKNANLIANCYWQLRALRPGDQARRRALYRRIADEKKRLLSEGVDAEALRLLCLHYADPSRELRRVRLIKRLAEVENAANEAKKASQPFP
ncbi:hypothetical protein HCX48_13490 [Rhodocyclus tenuis]|uniref:Uncharacterized protein n=1 Tax=Rhodocyclus gracilis TaxID=2929842 RepID=A0ABX0WN80_9RHOO|nr:hypothetical protein [Rhodocyclus gracilis]NJA90229.1 hypothetical protein [Rhodocyclus gracilis]